MATIGKKNAEYILKRRNLTGINAAPVLFQEFNELVDSNNDLESRVTDLEDGTSTAPLIVTDTTDATTKDTGSIITEGGIGVEKAIFAGTSITATTQLRVSATTNQIRLGNISAFDTIISSTAPAADSVYTIPDSGTAANFIMSEGTQTINGAKTFGTGIALPDGLVSALSLRLGADGNNGVYGISDTQLGIAVEGVLVGGFNTLGLFTDIISEQTVATGVTIDGLLIIDNSISNAASISSAGSITSGFFADGVQAITGSGAINVTKGRTEINTTGGGVYTLANGTDGQQKSIYMVVDAGDAVITPTGLLGFTTITLSAVGQGVTLTYSTSQSKWACVGNNGAVLA